MAESMVVDRKRDDRQESMHSFERIKRDRAKDIGFFKHYVLLPTDICPADFHHNPPNIDKYLKFNLHNQKQKISHLADQINTLATLCEWGDNIDNHTQVLADMVLTDPRLVGELDSRLLKFLIMFLSHKQNPKLQSQAVIILQLFVSHSDSESKQRVIKGITSSIIADLMSSEDCELKMLALCIFRTMAFEMPQSEFIEALEVTWVTLTHIINDVISLNEKGLCGVSMTLAVICQVYPKLPCDKLQLILKVLYELLHYSSSQILTYACMGLVYLCDGREDTVIHDMDLETIVCRLTTIVFTSVYKREFRASTTAALTALGTLVRWGDDDDREIIIGRCNTLRLLHYILSEFQDKQYLGNACWILSNITAGNEEHIITAVFDDGFIDLLLCVVQNSKLLDVKKEAAWAILNAVYGAGCDEDFKYRYVDQFWNILEVFHADQHADQEIISVCLEGLVISEGAQVIYNGQPINASELKKHLGTLLGLSQSELKKPRYYASNKKFKNGLTFYVTRTVEGDVQQPELEVRLFCKSSEEDILNMVDQMEVDEPGENTYILL